MTRAESDTLEVACLRPVMLMKAREMSRELQDRASFMIDAALAEVGWDVGSEWDDEKHWYVMNAHVPDEVLWKAQRLVLDALRIPYELRPAREIEDV